MTNITVVGTGYVGLVSGACLADFGNNVICVDNNQEKINQLKNGSIPIFEPGLDNVVNRTVERGSLHFSTTLLEAVQASDVIFIAVGTPPADDGRADIQFVEAAAREIARAMNSYKVIVDKSTVPVGTGKKVKEWIKSELETCGKHTIDFDVVSNPEFLREGSAVQDFTHPDRIVIGSESEKASKIMKDVYRVLYLNDTPYIETNIETAETIKYASNAFLAVKIAFINEMSGLCEKVGANVQDVARAMGKDGRIGSKFLHAGPGYGGSCFPKDTRAITQIASEHNAPLTIINAAIEANTQQKHRMVEKICNVYGGKEQIKGKNFAVLGLAFKPNTDDMRESPALTIISTLAEYGAVIHTSDPAAIPEAQWRLEKYKHTITYYDHEYETFDNADGIILLTEWNQYRTLDFTTIAKKVKQKIFFDFRNIYKRSSIEKQGFQYIGVGT